MTTTSVCEATHFGSVGAVAVSGPHYGATTAAGDLRGARPRTDPFARNGGLIF